MKLKKIMIACFFVPSLASGAIAQDKTGEDDKAFQDLFGEWADDTAEAAETAAQKRAFKGYLDKWNHIATGKTGAVYFMKNADIIQRLKQNPRVWIKSDHSQDNSVSFRTTMQLIEFDCPNSKLKIISLTEYNADGTVSDTFQDNFQSNYITPESIAESFATNACPVDN